MKKTYIYFVALFIAGFSIMSMTSSQSLYDFTMKSITGKDVSLSAYKGKVMLVVNVASACGYTSQYEGLEKLHQTYGSKGLSVLGFPANNFGEQEPGTNQEIQQFCKTKFGVKFDMFAKISVKGSDMNALYNYLTTGGGNPNLAGDVKWNFEKFLIGKDGHIIKRYSSRTAPSNEELIKDIEAALAK